MSLIKLPTFNDFYWVHNIHVHFTLTQATFINTSTEENFKMLAIEA